MAGAPETDAAPAPVVPSFGRRVEEALTPKRLRWDPDGNHELSWTLNLVFGFGAAFSVANLYYTHPILNVLAVDFGVSDERASLIPTLLQAGYAAGLLFIIPIGDIVRRRPLVLSIIFVTAFLWLGATLTKSYEAFMGLSFVIGICTCTPQFMFPLVVQYAPARHRATMTSIVMSGIVFGILVARLLAGIISQYTSWRAVYWLSFGLQILIFLLLFILMPDYPVLRPGTSYPQILLKIITIPFKKPLLLIVSIMAFLTMAMYTSFWTTLTFLLNDTFHMSTLVIGLFALIGISPVVLNPVMSHLMISKIHPTGSLIVGHLIALAGVIIGTFTGTFSVAGPVIWAFVGDLGMNIVVVASRVAIAGVDPTAQNAVNAVFMVFTFCGQLSGTAAGNNLYARGGWIHSGALSIGFVGASFLLIFVRGPHETGWVGWHGGWDLRGQKPKDTHAAAQTQPALPASSDPEKGQGTDTEQGEAEASNGREESVGEKLESSKS
ncbi:MFS general substrate transporter [Thozetella sp. PMI_491]|nr:MFS general substrate transporter [Thozetella sp. PMI_491]